MSVDKGDQSLLDRLNALKGNNDAGISLNPSSNALNASITIERAKPPSKEDALAARLRSLRNTPEREIPPTGDAAQSKGDVSSSPLRKSTSTKQPPAPTSGSSRETLDDSYPPLDTDDQTLEDLLRSEDDSQGPPEWAYAPNVEPGRAEALLEELSRGITPSSPPSNPKDQAPKPQDRAEEHPPDPDEDSDGEEMTRDVHTLLSRALDEAELEARLNPAPDPASPDTRAQNQPPPPQAESTSPIAGKGLTSADEAGLSLPSVPSALGSSEPPGLSLPSVPSTVGRTPEDIENDLAARMARLGAPSKGTVSAEGDPESDIGLPSVPTDQPANRLRTRTGYTDADEETWCTVCLEDATLRCLGCDDDVYCTRCWREMHVGPAAAFDDRTHKAVLFGRDPRKKEKRAMIGA